MRHWKEQMLQLRAEDASSLMLQCSMGSVLLQGFLATYGAMQSIRGLLRGLLGQWRPQSLHTQLVQARSLLAQHPTLTTEHECDAARRACAEAEERACIAEARVQCEQEEAEEAQRHEKGRAVEALQTYKNRADESLRREEVCRQTRSHTHTHAGRHGCRAQAMNGEDCSLKCPLQPHSRMGPLSQISCMRVPQCLHRTCIMYARAPVPA